MERDPVTESEEDSGEVGDTEATSGTAAAPRTDVGPSVEAAASSRIPWREVGAFLAALLAYLVAHGGLFFAGYAPAIQIGLLVGLVASLVARSPARAAMAAAAAGLVGPFIQLPLLEPSFRGVVLAAGSLAVTIAAVAVIGAATALCAAWLVEREVLRPRVLVVLGVALVIANLWLTTTTLVPNRQVVEGKTLAEFLTSRPTPGVKQSDQAYYVAVYRYMKDGLSYYAAVKRAYNENAVWGYNPPNVFAVREPLLFWFWGLFPNLKWAAWSLAALASVAAAMALAIPRGLAPLTTRLIGTAAVASYLLYFTTLPFVLGFEVWGGTLAVVCVGLYALGIGEGEREGPGSNRRRAFMVAAAVVSVVAVATRELMLFLPAAGLAASIFSPRATRRFDVGVWIAALGASLGAWAIHALAAQSIITHRAGLEKWAFRGGPDTLVMGLAHGASQLSSWTWLVVVLAACGVLGAALQSDRQYRIFALVALGIPLAFFVFAWNGAIDVATGARMNYWGSIVNPLLMAFVPGVLLIIPGMRAASPSAEIAGSEARSWPVDTATQQ